MDSGYNNKIAPRIIQSTDNILSALKQMDTVDTKLLFVFNNDSFVNILSIGDIQRAIIKNIPLNTSVSQILRAKTNLAKLGESFESIKSKMLEFRAECMPVVDSNNQLVEVYFWEDVFLESEKRNAENLDLPVVIMAGGMGTRLKPLTNVLPKPLIPLGEKTILENIMDSFLEVGCYHFFLSVNYKAEMIRHYFDTLQAKTYQIHYLYEEKPLGTIGSLFMLKGKINSTFFVSNCDIIIHQDYKEIYTYHKENNNEITIIAALKHYKIPYGTIESAEDGILTSLSEKPELTFKINTGMYVLEPGLLNEIPENKHFHITELIEQVRKRKGKVGVFPVSAKSWQDIGEWEEYLKIAR